MHPRPYALAFASGAPSPQDTILLVFCTRAIGPKGAPQDMALGLLSALCAYTHTHNPTAFNCARDTPIHVHPWTFPPGSWAVLTRNCWQGPIDSTLMYNTRTHALSHQDQAWPSLEAFKGPRMVARGLPELAAEWHDPWWDSTILGVLLGAIESHGALPGMSTVRQTWMFALLLSAARALQPWLGDPTIPARGYGKRAFPAKATVQRVAEDTMAGLLGHHHSSNMHHIWLDKLPTLQVLVPNAPYGATGWMPGPAWGRATARFPQEIIAAGRAAGAILPQDWGPHSHHDILEGQIEGSAHERMAFARKLSGPDTILRAHAPTYARPTPTRRRKNA